MDPEQPRREVRLFLSARKTGNNLHRRSFREIRVMYMSLTPQPEKRFRK